MPDRVPWTHTAISRLLHDALTTTRSARLGGLTDGTLLRNAMNETPGAAELIERAFSLARQSGKSDWWTMTIPVLKNRLLQLTKNRFKEADFGAASFRAFLKQVPDIVRVEETPLPGFVILKSAAHEHAEGASVTAVRGDQIRADLWRAVLDYSSGVTYVWDVARHAAGPAKPADVGPVLPTISEADLDGWRMEFLALHRPADPTVAKRVEEWCKSRLPTVALPTTMRPVWNNYLKRKVERRLGDWFTSHAIEAPTLTEARPESSPSDERVEALRQFVIACVQRMSRQELLELRISPITAMRTLQTQESGGKNER
jgi:hypothetical protein